MNLVGKAACWQLESAGCVLCLLGRSFGIERRVDELLRGGLSIIIVAAGLQRFVVFIDSFGAIALGVVGVAAFDVGPRFNPGSLAAARVDGRLKSGRRQLPVLLFEINETQRSGCRLFRTEELA